MMTTLPVFQINTEKRLTANGLRPALLRIGKRANIHITPYALRRTFATHITSSRNGFNPATSHYGAFKS